MKQCEFCQGEVIKKEWAQTVEGGLCPQGTYEYGECSKCGMRYSLKEISEDG